MDMKFRAHDTFFIRKGWLSKGMRNVIADKDVFITKDKDRNPMDVLGIGANMVKALRYWLQAVGLTEEPSKGQRFQYLTELGQIIYDQDPYIEEIGTLWLLQYQLAKNKMDATASVSYTHLDVYKRQVESGAVKTVVTKDLSRLGRNYLQVGLFTEITFPKKGVRFIAINDGVDSAQGDNDMSALRNLFNEWMVRDTSKKIKAVFRAKGMSGKPITSQPVSYTHLRL